MSLYPFQKIGQVVSLSPKAAGMEGEKLENAAAVPSKTTTPKPIRITLVISVVLPGTAPLPLKFPPPPLNGW